MIDPVIANLIERVTKLELQLSVNSTTLNGRIETLEQAAAQEASDKIQAERREMADLRRRVEAAEAGLKKAGGA